MLLLLLLELTVFA